MLKQQLIHGEIGKYKAGSQQGSDEMLVLLSRTPEAFNVPNSMSGCQVTKAGVGSVVRADEPLTWRDPL